MIMIPKIIHYCWFGKSPLPKDAQECIASWRKFFPDYEIKEWNESNFDVNCCPYVREAYEQKKYAFVSDYARFWVLYNIGGLYFDTDVEVISSFDQIIEKGNFMGFEKSLATQNPESGEPLGVAVGLGMGAEPNMPLIKTFLEFYESKPYFSIEDGTIVVYTTEILKKYGLVNEHRLQNVAGFSIYPADYFCPMDSTTGLIEMTENTVSIHHYSCSWIDKNTLCFRLHLLKNKMIKIFGPKFVFGVIGVLGLLKSKIKG